MAILDKMWHTYLDEIYCNGAVCTKDDGDEIKEIFGVHKFIAEPQHLYPIKVDDVDVFLSNMKKGWYDIPDYSIKGDALYEYVTAWNKLEMINIKDSGFVYTYPERLSNIKVFDKYSDSSRRINQYQVLLTRLNTHRESNRAVATLYNAGLDRNEQHIPCLNFLQALIRNDVLYLSCMFRSNDIFNAWPSNMYLLTHLGMMLASETNTVFGGIDYHCSSAHYYIKEEELVKRCL